MHAETPLVDGHKDLGALRMYYRLGARYMRLGIGSGFDGVRRLPEGLGDVSTFKDLTVEFLRRGWSDGDIQRLPGRNFLRVLREAQNVAQRLQEERQPSVVRMEE